MNFYEVAEKTDWEKDDLPQHVNYLDNYLNQQNLTYVQVMEIIWKLKGVWDDRNGFKGLAFAQRKTLEFLPKWWELLAPRKDDAAYKLKDDLTCFVAVDPFRMKHLPHLRAGLVLGGSIGKLESFQKRVLAGIACAENKTDGIELKRYISKETFRLKKFHKFYLIR